MSGESTGGYNSGRDMWADHKAHFGVITAHIMCSRYLDMASRSTDPEERRFCEQLSEAMAMEPNFKDRPYYAESFDYAQLHSEETLFNDSDSANVRCADEIEEAVNACRYQDGSYKLDPAVRAIFDRHNIDRVNHMLAVEVLRKTRVFPEHHRAWARGFTINSGFARRFERLGTNVLDAFITGFRDAVYKNHNAKELQRPPAATDSPGLNESGQNFAAWMAVTDSSRFHWVEDEIVRLNGRGAMYYTGGEDGIYMRIGKDGLLEAGRYEGAVPHIGEAMFRPEVTRRFDSFNDAFTAAMEAGGKPFLVDMFSGSEPQPLFQTAKGRAPEEKSSVLKQIRDAREAPKLQDRGKTPDQKKHKGGPEL